MIHILQLSDTHLFADPQRTLYDVNTRDTLSSVMRHITGRFEQIDAMLLTGDLVHDESSEGYSALHSMVSQQGSKVYYLPGNHDDPETMREVLVNSASRKLYLVELGAWAIVLLDSSVRGKVEGQLSTDMLDQLGKFLRSNEDKHVLIALHHHIIGVESPWLDALKLKNHDELTQVLEQYPAVKLVINGHIHQETDVLRNGIPYLGTPATCFQFAVQSQKGGKDERPPAYRHIVLKDDGTVDTSVHYVIPE